jgi:hypothetical protein
MFAVPAGYAPRAARSTLACGSMVLYVYCVSFFRPAGRKNDTQRTKHHRQAKVLLYLVFALAERKNQIQKRMTHLGTA